MNSGVIQFKSADSIDEIMFIHGTYFLSYPSFLLAFNFDGLISINNTVQFLSITFILPHSHMHIDT